MILAVLLSKQNWMTISHCHSKCCISMLVFLACQSLAPHTPLAVASALGVVGKCPQHGRYCTKPWCKGRTVLKCLFYVWVNFRKVSWLQNSRPVPLPDHHVPCSRYSLSVSLTAPGQPEEHWALPAKWANYAWGAALTIPPRQQYPPPLFSSKYCYTFP